MVVQNPFSNNPYSMADTTEAINILPETFGMVNSMGLFAPKYLSTRTAIIDVRNGTLSLLPSVPVGAPATKAKRDKKSTRSIMVPRIPFNDRINASEISGVRPLGSYNMLEQRDAVVNDHQMKMKRQHEETREYMMVSALKGEVRDGAGDLVNDLYDTFDVTATTINFELDDANTDLRAKCEELRMHVRRNMGGALFTRIEALVSSEFMAALRSHDNAVAAYERWEDGRALRQGQEEDFLLHNILFKQYDGEGTLAGSDTVTQFIADGEGHAYPVGSRDVFDTYYSPADWWETVNTTAIPIYSDIEYDKYGADLITESNCLPVCRRPQALVKLTAS